jgi:hypothetical protein
MVSHEIQQILRHCHEVALVDDFTHLFDETIFVESKVALSHKQSPNHNKHQHCGITRTKPFIFLLKITLFDILTRNTVALDTDALEIDLIKKIQYRIIYSIAFRIVQQALIDIPIGRAIFQIVGYVGIAAV